MNQPLIYKNGLMCPLRPYFVLFLKNRHYFNIDKNFQQNRFINDCAKNDLAKKSFFGIP